jgi:hypothetical protein
MRSLARILHEYVCTFVTAPRWILLRIRNVSDKCSTKYTFLFSVDKKNQLDVTFVFFISLVIVAHHVSGNHVPIIRS